LLTDGSLAIIAKKENIETYQNALGP